MKLWDKIRKHKHFSKMGTFFKNSKTKFGKRTFFENHFFLKLWNKIWKHKHVLKYAHNYWNGKKIKTPKHNLRHEQFLKFLNNFQKQEHFLNLPEKNWKHEYSSKLANKFRNRIIYWNPQIFLKTLWKFWTKT